jgi:hypothetical protein
MMEIAQLLLGLGVLATFGVLVWLLRKLEKERTVKISQLAAGLGLEFHPLGDIALQQRLGKLHLFNIGHSRELINLVTGEKDDCRISIFDYHYSTFSGKGRSETKLTVVALESPRLRIPAFTLRPEFSLDKIGGRIGLQDIDFEDNVSFSQGYVLKSSDEGETRKLFNRALQDFFVQQSPGCCVEAIDGTIVYYNILRSGRINRKPEDYPRLLDEAYRLLRLILDR